MQILLGKGDKGRRE